MFTPPVLLGDQAGKLPTGARNQRTDEYKTKDGDALYNKHGEHRNGYAENADLERDGWRHDPAGHDAISQRNDVQRIAYSGAFYY